MLLLQFRKWFLKVFRSLIRSFTLTHCIFNSRYPESVRQNFRTSSHCLENAPVVSGHQNRTIYRVGQFFVKRYQRLTFFGLLKGFPATPIAHEWQNLKQAESLGLQPVLWIATGIDTDHRPFLTSLALDSSVPVNEFIQHAHPDSLLVIAGRLGRLLGKMICTQFIHGDLTAKHVLVHRLTHQINILDWQRVYRSVLIHNMLARLLASLCIKSRHRQCINTFFTVFCHYAGISYSQRQVLRKEIIHTYRRYRNHPSSIEQRHLISTPDQRLMHVRDGMQSIRLTHLSLVRNQFCVPLLDDQYIKEYPKFSDCLAKSTDSSWSNLQLSYGGSFLTKPRNFTIPGRCFRLERLNIPTRFIIFFGCTNRFFSRRWFVVSLDPAPLEPVTIFNPRLCDLINALDDVGYRLDSIDVLQHALVSQQYIVYAVERLRRL